MKKITVFFCLCWLLEGLVFAGAWDWQQLHDQADSLSLGLARKNASQNPASRDAAYILGLVYLNLHQDQEAEEIFSRLASRDPKDFPAQWGLAEVLRRRHQLKESQEILEGLIKDHPDFSPAYISLAYTKYRQMDFKATVSLTERVMRQGRDHVDLSNYVRAILIYSGTKGMLAHYGGPFSKLINGTAVFPALKKAARLKPNDAGVLFGLGSFYLLAPKIAGGDIEQAEIYLKKAVQADPLFTDTYVRLAQFYKAKGDNQQYERYLARALEIDPWNELALDIKSGQCRFICLDRE